jgi:hypothetical protein
MVYRYNYSLAFSSFQNILLLLCFADDPMLCELHLIMQIIFHTTPYIQHQV